MKKAINSKKVLEYIGSKNISKTKFCEDCELSRTTLNKLLKGGTNYSLTVVFKIATTMGCSINELYG